MDYFEYAEKGDKMLHHFQGKIEIGTGNGGIISQLRMQKEMKLTDKNAGVKEIGYVE